MAGSRDIPTYDFQQPSDEQVKAAFDALKEASKNASAVDEAVLASLDKDFRSFMEFLADNTKQCKSAEERMEYVNKAERAYYNQTQAKQKIHDEAHKTQRGAIVTVAKYVFAAAALLGTGAAAAFVITKK